MCTIRSVDENVRKLIGKWLRRARFDRELKAIDVAAQTGIHHTRLSKIEHGWYAPTTEELRKLRKVLGDMPPELKLLYAGAEENAARV